MKYLSVILQFVFWMAISCYFLGDLYSDLAKDQSTAKIRTLYINLEKDLIEKSLKAYHCILNAKERSEENELMIDLIDTALFILNENRRIDLENISERLSLTDTKELQNKFGVTQRDKAIASFYRKMDLLWTNGVTEEEKKVIKLLLIRNAFEFYVGLKANNSWSINALKVVPAISGLKNTYALTDTIRAEVFLSFVDSVYLKDKYITVTVNGKEYSNVLIDQVVTYEIPPEEEGKDIRVTTARLEGCDTVVKEEWLRINR